MSDLFEAVGSLRAAYRAVDWGASSLGPVSSWSLELRTVLDVAWRTCFPVAVLWGPQFVLVYNQAYVDLIGDKHPAALGAPAEQVYPELWDTIGPMLTEVRDTGQPSWSQDMRLVMDRHGFAEEGFYTFSYSAVHGVGGVEGVVVIAAETTAQVLLSRRMALLATLTDQLAGLDDPDEVIERAVSVLRDSPLDFVGAGFAASDNPPSTVTTIDGDGLLATSAEGVTVLHVPRAPLSGGRGPVVWAELNRHLSVDDVCRRSMRLLAATVTQAFDRAQARQAERRITMLDRDLSYQLQHSLLTEPARPDHLQVAVRYQPAAEQAHIGGDWYDAFLLPDNALAIAVGDVTGHDHHAAAVMAQLRNLLRGVAYTIAKPPAQELQALDTAMRGLHVDALATVLLARVEDDTSQPGALMLRWSNAGHPCPLLLQADGTVTLLHTASEPLLGAGITATRTDHTVVLPPGSSVVLYTDGLIERRGASIDDATSELTTVLTDCQHLSAEQLCDHLLARYASTADDDIVILVVQTPT
ncbi:PP2C family protein-serine/threonine phosphatase [Actinoplanes sp. TFC3]|uniref:PP2C family protein-serine/threonine phosphatase n=1 Tax=Actinoplanes sp. TFC3 TaxID=1710355 RepID=UPI000A994A7E|nr:PP2C family protein-serine/threonine phosphatase [Actinoplanes sp. TFC3]